MGESDLFAARYGPGFSAVLTSWQVFIARNRWLRQKVVVYDRESPYHNRVLWFWAKLSRQEVTGISRIAELIRFERLDHHYQPETVCMTDCETYSVSVRFGDRVKEVEAYAMRWVAEFEEQPAVLGIEELWDAITARSPFGKVPIEQGLPRPWWRVW